MNRFGLFFAPIIFFGLNTYSQSKIYVSVDASPTYSFRSYKLMDYSTGNSNIPSGKVLYDYFKKYSDSIESPTVGYEMSVNIGYSITNKLALITGFHYNRIGYKINKTIPVGHFISDGNIISSVYDNTKLDLYSNLYYLGIPLGLQYNVYTIGKFNLGLNIGGSIDFLLKHDTRDVDNSKENYSEYPKITLDINAGIQLGYMINDKFEVYVMPQISDYITSNVKINWIESNDLSLKINQYNYYGDLKFGLKYRL